MTTIKLDSELQVQIFFLLYENPKGLTRTQLAEKLEKPRTTIYDTLTKMFNKRINDTPYVKFYSKPTFLRGRPVVYFYIPKLIRGLKLDFKIDKEGVNHT